MRRGSYRGGFQYFSQRLHERIDLRVGEGQGRQEPQLRIVGRVVVAFLDRYLKREHGALRRMTSAGDVPGISTLIADP